MEHEIEPIPGLPRLLPPGERVLWQGRPDWRVFASTTFHTRSVALYFALLVAVAVASGTLVGAGMTALAGVAGVAVLTLLAWIAARATRYTLTNKRLVLRVGMAVPKCVNLPLSLVAAVDLRTRRDGSGDLALRLSDARGVSYLLLWPHARPWRFNAPQPMLRAVPDAARVGQLLARTIQAAQGVGLASAPRLVSDAEAAPAGVAVAA